MEVETLSLEVHSPPIPLLLPHKHKIPQARIIIHCTQNTTSQTHYLLHTKYHKLDYCTQECHTIIPQIFLFNYICTYICICINKLVTATLTHTCIYIHYCIVHTCTMYVRKYCTYVSHSLRAHCWAWNSICQRISMNTQSLVCHTAVLPPHAQGTGLVSCM